LLGYTHPDTFSNITTHRVNTNFNFFFDELEARDVPEEWGVGSGEWGVGSGERVLR
jgi:hypothetical protein